MAANQGYVLFLRGSSPPGGQVLVGAGKGIGSADCFASCRAIQTRSNRAGIVTTVVSNQKGIQPSVSASTPDEEATRVRPTTAREESRAYCVAVNSGEHKLER